ncbi:MAG: hypothetical protein MMC33_009615 [Icmadophila ericetorum]|nr:hypothetical protein [Icmadophila ericetorum]
MNNITTLIQRLEDATSRLEGIVAATQPQGSSASNGLLSSTGAAAAIPEVSEPPPRKQLPDPLPPAIDNFDSLINVDVKKFIGLSEELGGLVAEQAACLLRAFGAERKFLILTTKAKKPEMQSPIYMEILRELQETMGAVSELRELNRESPTIPYLTTVAEGIPMLGWITIEPKPADYVGETLSGAQYYGNRILKEHRNKNQTHVDWVEAYYKIFQSLQLYIKQHYPSGVTWNNRDGIDPREALRQVQSGEATPKLSTSDPSSSIGRSSSSGPPPPPPLPTFDTPPAPPLPPNGSAAQGGDMGAIFDQLSKGEAVTAGLRKVDPSQQTHKNPSLRAGAVVPPSRSDSQSSDRGKSPVPSKKPKPETMRVKKPPRKVFDSNKWMIENYDSPSEIIEIEAKITQSVLISKCTNTTFRITNKANAISIDSSTKVSLIIDSLISSVDVIKTARFEMQVLGTLPTILLDQVDGASIYLSKESLGTEVFTSKCTAINVLLPGQQEEDDFKECALPEQIKTVFDKGAPVSEIVEHAG